MSPLTTTHVSAGIVLSLVAPGLTITHQGDIDLGSYDLGDAITLKADFTNTSGVATNPTAVTCQVKNPDGTISNVTLSVSGSPTGHYEAVFTPTMAGRHVFRFAGTGTVVAAEEKVFSVKRQQVA